MRKPLLLLLFGISACSGPGPDADLQYIKQARSVGAEWALVNEQAAHNRLTQIYVASMHQWLRQQLQTASAALASPDTRYALEIRALLALPDDAPPEELRAHAGKLRDIEDELESA